MITPPDLRYGELGNNCMKKSKRKISVGSLSNDHGDGDGDGNENGRIAILIGIDWQNNNFTRVSRFFVYFFAVVERLRRETSCFHVLWRTWTQDNNFFSWTSIQSFRIQPQKKSLLFAELNEME